MCGIIGYSGTGEPSNKLFQGLRAMEYRGYDSWGIAVLTQDGIFLEKQTGSLSHLTRTPKDFLSVGIGHTRWATHGGVTQNNAHPHQSVDGRFVVAQNGIVENFLELKKMLQEKGYIFTTQTDTEIIVHLVHWEAQQTSDFPTAIRKAFLQLSGRNTFIVLDNQTQSIFAIRQGSPLVLGESEKEVVLASDVMPLIGSFSEVISIDDNQLVTIHGTEAHLYSAQTGKEMQPRSEKLPEKVQQATKDGFDHFMLKEIQEQQYTLTEAASYSAEELAPLVQKLKKARNIYTLGAGTAFFAAGQIARFLREVGLQASELRSYESENYLPLINRKDVVLVVSQSGETADTLEVVEQLKQKKVCVVSIVNMVGSTLTRMSDFSFLSRSGPEICVASTKAYTAQVTWGYLLAQTIIGKHAEAKTLVRQVSAQIKEYFQEKSYVSEIKKLALQLVKEEHVFVLGKSQHLYSALEGALKLKEITYKHFEGFSSGELKHGVIALVEKGTFVFGIIGGEEKEKRATLNALAEVKARGAFVVGISAEPHEFFDIHIFASNAKDLDCVTKVVPFQLLSYYLALELHRDPDKPRNLAKSVTVK